VDPIVSMGGCGNLAPNGIRSPDRNDGRDEINRCFYQNVSFQKHLGNIYTRTVAFLSGQDNYCSVVNFMFYYEN
jgi:hypothetical protein